MIHDNRKGMSTKLIWCFARARTFLLYKIQALFKRYTPFFISSIFVLKIYKSLGHLYFLFTIIVLKIKNWISEETTSLFKYIYIYIYIWKIGGLVKNFECFFFYLCFKNFIPPFLRRGLNEENEFSNWKNVFFLIGKAFFQFKKRFFS